MTRATDSRAAVALIVALAVALPARVMAQGASDDCLSMAELVSAAAAAVAADTTRAAQAAAPVSVNERPDIVLQAQVAAREVRFARPPVARVRLCFNGVTDSVRVVERRNLPSPVQPGVTYRDVLIAAEVLAHLRAECAAPRTAAGAEAQPAPAACAALGVTTRTGRDGGTSR